MRHRDSSTREVYPTLLFICILPLLMCHHYLRKPEYEVDHGWFAHLSHAKEQEIPCGECHEGIEESGSAEDNNHPRVEICLSCHERGEPPCTMCDRDPSEAVPGQFRGRNLIFSHRAHLERNLTCGRCHGAIAAAKGKGSERFIPAMKTCLACHDNRPCERCHADMQARGFKPKGHDAFWPRAHALTTRSEARTCEACHAPGWCQACHQGDIETRHHTDAFIDAHGLEARLTPGKCDSCHLNNFCRNCHGALKGNNG